ncbi:MAG: hypothetical protein ACYTF8_14155 [Planctomycetota bacterium]|jgi:hypothetical protein
MRKLMLLVLAAALVACGNENAPGTARPSVRRDSLRDTARPVGLVPADAIVVIRLRSFDALRGLVKQVEKATGQTPVGDPLEQISAATDVDPRQVVADRPALIAVNLVGQPPRPKTTYILPVKEPEAVAAKSPLGHAVMGGYVGLSEVPGYKAGTGSVLANDLPDKNVVVRVDLARIVEVQGPAIRMQLGMAQAMAANALQAGAPGSNPASMAWLFGSLKDLVDSAETLEVVADNRGSVLDVDLAYTAKNGSTLDRAPEKSTLGELATHLPADFPLVLLFTLDLAGVMDLFDAFGEAVPEPARADFKARMAAAKAMLHGLGAEWVSSVDVSKQGFRMVFAGRAKDAGAYVQRYVDLVGAKVFRDAGVVATSEGKRTVGGATVHRLRLKLDAQKYAEAHGARAGEAASFFTNAFGEKGAVVDLAAAGDRIIVTVDRDGGLCEQVLSSDGVPADVDSALGRVPGELGFLLHLDVRGLLRGLAEYRRATGRTAPEVPEGGPVPIAVYGSRAGRVYQAGLSIELEQTGLLVDLMKRK